DFPLGMGNEQKESLTFWATPARLQMNLRSAARALGFDEVVGVLLARAAALANNLAGDERVRSEQRMDAFSEMPSHANAPSFDWNLPDSSRRVADSASIAPP